MYFHRRVQNVYSFTHIYVRFPHLQRLALLRIRGILPHLASDPISLVVTPTTLFNTCLLFSYLQQVNLFISDITEYQKALVVVWASRIFRVFLFWPKAKRLTLLVRGRGQGNKEKSNIPEKLAMQGSKLEFCMSFLQLESACNAGDLASIPASGRSPRERNGNPHSSILAWEIPWTEEPGRLESLGLQESDMTQQLNHHHHLMLSNVYL